MPRRYLKLLICALSAVIAWTILPGTFIDRALFSLTVRSFVQEPFFITGTGIHKSAYTLHTLKRQNAPSGDPLPEIAITDDPDRVFQTSPPSPVDFAVILKNLRRLGRDSIAIGIPLAWQQTDIISLMALDQQLDTLPSVVTAAPLTRGAAPSPLPPAFRRASIALSNINGNAHNLPRVNRISIPDVVLGNKSSLAGFTLLESEPDGELPHLIARWDDRVVLSFALLAALADQGISPANIEIHMGEFISFAKDGPFIPIDEFGRLAFAPHSSHSFAPIPAETLIDAPDNFLTKRRGGTVLLRNGMSAADIPSMRFSEALIPTVSLLADPSSISGSKPFNRIPLVFELILIASLICLLLILESLPTISNGRALIIFAGVFVVLHFILVRGNGTWPPTLPALTAILAAISLTVRRDIVPIILATNTEKQKAVKLPKFQHELETVKKCSTQRRRKTKKKSAKKSPGKRKKK